MVNSPLPSTLLSNTASPGALIKEALVKQKPCGITNKKLFITFATECLNKILSGITDESEKKALAGELVKLMVAGNIAGLLEAEQNCYKQASQEALENHFSFPAEKLVRAVGKKYYDLASQPSKGSLDKDNAVQEKADNLAIAYKAAASEILQPFVLKTLQNNFICYFRHLAVALLERSADVLKNKTLDPSKVPLELSAIQVQLAQLKNHTNYEELIASAMPLILKIKYLNQQACFIGTDNPLQDTTLEEILNKISAVLHVLYKLDGLIVFGIKKTNDSLFMPQVESHQAYSNNMMTLLNNKNSMRADSHNLLADANTVCDTLIKLRPNSNTYGGTGHFFAKKLSLESEGAKLCRCIDRLKQQSSSLDSSITVTPKAARSSKLIIIN